MTSIAPQPQLMGKGRGGRVGCGRGGRVGVGEKVGNGGDEMDEKNGGTGRDRKKKIVLQVVRILPPQFT